MTRKQMKVKISVEKGKYIVKVVNHKANMKFKRPI